MAKRRSNGRISKGRLSKRLAKEARAKEAERVKRVEEAERRSVACPAGERRQKRGGLCKVPCRKPSRRTSSGNCSRPRSATLVRHAFALLPENY